MTGLILYNGQSAVGGDFISLGLVGSQIEFRIDVGSGPTVIKSDPIDLNTWHTVRIKKDKSTGKISLTNTR